MASSLYFYFANQYSLGGCFRFQYCRCLGTSYLCVTDTIQERSNLDFDIKCATIQFYGNNHNSPSDRWIGLKFYVKSPDMFFYLGLNFRLIGVREGISIRVHRDCTDFVIYFLLTCGLPIWL